MTGFARAAGQSSSDTIEANWQWELRTVNGRGLDVRLRLPSGFEQLEAPSRKAISGKLARGNVQAGLQVTTRASGGGLALNEETFEQAATAARRAAQLYGTDAPDLESLLRMRGVIDAVDTELDTETKDVLSAEMLATLDLAIDETCAMRTHEGGQLRAIIADQLDLLETHMRAIMASPTRSSDALRARLAEQISKVIESGIEGVDPARVAQELALLVTKADIEEELTRLAAHIESVRALIGENKPAGRRLDFLSQELNREANTICSKSNDLDVTNHGMELKVIIDQFREQVQNVE